MRVEKRLPSYPSGRATCPHRAHGVRNPIQPKVAVILPAGNVLVTLGRIAPACRHTDAFERHANVIGAGLRVDTAAVALDVTVQTRRSAPTETFGSKRRVAPSHLEGQAELVSVGRALGRWVDVEPDRGNELVGMLRQVGPVIDASETASPYYRLTNSVGCAMPVRRTSPIPSAGTFKSSHNRANAPQLSPHPVGLKERAMKRQVTALALAATLTLAQIGAAAAQDRSTTGGINQRSTTGGTNQRSTTGGIGQ